MTDTSDQNTQNRATISPEVVRPDSLSIDQWNRILLYGDLAGLTVQQQAEYVAARCRALNISPLNNPFLIQVYADKKGQTHIILIGTKALYAHLLQMHRATVEIIDRKLEVLHNIPYYRVTVRATLPLSHTVVENDGIVPLPVGLTMIDVANARMKAVTKAQCRALFMASGLAIPCIEEMEDLGAIDDSQPTSTQTTQQARVGTLVRKDQTALAPHTADKDLQSVLDAEASQPSQVLVSAAPNTGATQE